VLHVTACNEPSLVLDDGSRVVAFLLKLPRASDATHWRGEMNKVPYSFGDEGGELYFGSGEPMSLIQTFYSLYERARLKNKKSNSGCKKSRSSSRLSKSAFATGARASGSAKNTSCFVCLVSSKRNKKKEIPYKEGKRKDIGTRAGYTIL
jgi:hypothetical protein